MYHYKTSKHYSGLVLAVVTSSATPSATAPWAAYANAAWPHTAAVFLEASIR